MKIWTKLTLIQLLMLFILPIPLSGQAEEHVVKAAFLERFTRFIDWPDNSGINDSTQNYIIGILGDGPLQDNIEEIYKNQKIKIKNKNIEFKYLESVKHLEFTHLLLISSSFKKELPQILKFTQKKPILTVSDYEGFAKKGVLINFIIVNGKVRFEINESAVHESKLTISYLLLHVAKIVNPRGGG